MGKITLKLKELRALISEASSWHVDSNDPDHDPYARQTQIYDALEAWSQGVSIGKTMKNITPDIVEGIKDMIREGQMSEPDKSVTLHRGIVISEKQLIRWLQLPPDEPLKRKGQVAAKIVVGKEGPGSWTPRGAISANFAGVSRESVAHYLDDPFAVILSAKVRDNPGAFVELGRFSMYEQEMESISIAPVTTSIVSWVKSGTSQRRHEVMDELERMVQYIGI